MHHAVVLEDFSIDVSISYSCRTDMDEAMVIYFLGVRTDKQGSGILIWKRSRHTHKKKNQLNDKKKRYRNSLILTL